MPIVCYCTTFTINTKSIVNIALSYDKKSLKSLKNLQILKEIVKNKCKRAFSQKKMTF